MVSPKKPTMKSVDGKPSNTILSKRPKPKLPIKAMFNTVAVSQYFSSCIPFISIADMPKYSTIKTLKILVKSILSTLKSKNKGKTNFGFTP